jgi:hypothetical protein
VGEKKSIFQRAHIRLAEQKRVILQQYTASEGVVFLGGNITAKERA